MTLPETGLWPRPSRLWVSPRLPSTVNCHSLQATGITNYLSNGSSLEDARAIAAHESSQTTRLYDRTGDKITLDEIERIRF